MAEPFGKHLIHALTGNKVELFSFPLGNVHRKSLPFAGSKASSDFAFLHSIGYVTAITWENAERPTSGQERQ